MTAPEPRDASPTGNATGAAAARPARAAHALAAAAPATSVGWRLPFFLFAAAYFMSALLRAVTATLAPHFSAAFALDAADLGLLGGAYFLGFASLQLPLGAALDRWGARRVEASLLVLAIAGCVLFASAQGFGQLVAARVAIGMGVASCLMAPLFYYRQRFDGATQLRLNSWMLMTGSLGMVASTVPVQLLLPVLGWRGIFWASAGGLALCTLALALWLPPVRQPAVAGGVPRGRYAEVLGARAFWRVAPTALLLYGGMIALQTLWAGPWLTRVVGQTAAEASRGLLLINLGMLVAFFTWGSVMPVLTRRGLDVDRLMAHGLWLSLAVLGLNVLLGPRAGALHWMLWCMSTSVVALGQPALAQAFPMHLSGRALSAYNLAVFVGVFALQWGIGAAIDALRRAGLSELRAFQAAFAVLWLLCLASHLWFLYALRVHRAAGAAQAAAAAASTHADNRAEPRR